MVRLRPRHARAGHRGKLTGDPVLIEGAAVALSLGYDPLRYLGHHPDDLVLVTAVLEKAQQIRQDREKALADYLAGKTAGLTARSITRWIARAFK
ncbi:hypothetical protein SAMN05421872_102349 [Nocardioides lianchengensis]|uniref:Uncharacterized protein n=1 Tax=Nocardioides lianchengensis TaxID=1045774 RepID=A0A1G6LSX2_9ACTN|nr:hypothetical protein [Nocardioides lianchengensis]SDC46291.1 hypothetical protein SAMN05421872_102349 [Nocardioides lianchengensis]